MYSEMEMEMDENGIKWCCIYHVPTKHNYVTLCAYDEEQ